MVVAENKKIVDPSSVANILTLRYDTTQKPLLKKLHWADFGNSNEVSLYEIEQLIEQSIIAQLDKQSKVVLGLSGGVDSTLNLSILKNKFPDIEVEAVSIKFADSIDETIISSELAEKFNIKHHVVYLENYLVELPKAISMVGFPFWDLHFYHLVKKAKTISDCLISGDGGDELFGGYVFRYEKFLSLISKGSSPIEKVQAYLQCHERDWVPDQTDLFGKKTQFSWTHIYNKMLEYFDNDLDPLNQVFLADFNGKLLYNWSLVNTALTTNLDVKLVTPFISDKLIEYAIKIPSAQKYDQKNHLGKIPLRKILNKYVDESLISQEKQGFTANTVNLWKSHGHELCKEYLCDARVVEDDWIKKEWISKYIDNENLDVRYVNKFLGILAFEIWYRLFITKELNSNTLLN